MHSGNEHVDFSNDYMISARVRECKQRNNFVAAGACFLQFCSMEEEIRVVIISKFIGTDHNIFCHVQQCIFQVKC